MKNIQLTKYFGWFSILIGIIHFFSETWFYINFSPSTTQISAEYIGVLLLIVGGVIVIKTHKGKGILCGAWGYVFCPNYRAFTWKIDVFMKDNLNGFIDNSFPFLVLTFIAFIFSISICLPNKKLN